MRKIFFFGILILFILLMNPVFAQGNDMKKSPRFKHNTRYDSLVKKYAKHYGFDWRLILAQIKQESGFNPAAKNKSGAGGLMQIMPRTARELKIKNILNPTENISAGIYYLRKQYNLFPDVLSPHREMFALACYNCGAGRIHDSRDLAKFESIPHSQWEGIQSAMPKLSPIYKELHLRVWQKPKPPYGYFTGCQETIHYVNRVWSYYLEYQNQLI